MNDNFFFRNAVACADLAELKNKALYGCKTILRSNEKE